MSETVKTSKTLVQLKLPSGMVNDVDRLAAEEMISRTAWICRLLLNATRNERDD